MKQSSKQEWGFTIIEVMIVLAVAGLIMLIVFLAVPALQRNARNTQRKEAMGQIEAALEEYRNNNAQYPFTNTEEQSFVNGYLKKGLPGLYTIKYSDGVDADGQNSAHSYVPPLDTIKFELGHWCNTPTDNDGTNNPIQGNDSNKFKYAIWTRLETGSSTTVYCIDNYSQG